MSDTSQIFTDSRVTMDVTVIDTLLEQVVLPSDPVPTKNRQLLGYVLWVDHDIGVVSVYWETGAIYELPLNALRLAE